VPTAFRIEPIELAMDLGRWVASRQVALFQSHRR
jgi:hypothetical protein